MRKTLIAFSIAAALGTGAALAAPQDASTPLPSLKRLDANGDGKIDRKEAAASPALAGRLDTLDQNKDGALSREELPRPLHGQRHQGPGEGGQQRMAALDSNHDGRISAEEAKADPKAAGRFAQMDLNKDGYLDKADHALGMKQHHDAWFSRADSNKDGQLSKAEFDAAKQARSMHGGSGDRRGAPAAAPAPAAGSAATGS